MIAITNNKVHNSIKFKGKVVTKRKRGAEGSVASNHMSDRLSNKPLPGEETTATPTSSTKRKTINNFDKNQVLDTYSSYCANKGCQLPVTSSTKGKKLSSVKNNIPSNHEIISNSKMKPSSKLQYRVATLTFENVVPTIIKDYEIYALEDKDIRSLTCVNKLFSSMIPDIIRLRNLDFSELTQPRFNYEEQVEISSQRVDMATAAMIQFGMNPGLLVRFMSGEYTGANRDIDQLELNIGQYIDPEDMQHIRRILTYGCPAQLDFEEELNNKLKLIDRGNQKSFEERPEVVNKTLNKEEKYSHVIALKYWIVYASAFCRHNMQGMNMKKTPRVVWDQSTKLDPSDVVLNEITNTDFEAIITFGSTKIKLYTIIYNYRISFPDKVILLAGADVKACFRYPRIAADLTGAFGFLAQNMLFLSTSQVFGSNTSCPSWEPFRRAIEIMTVIYHDKEGLVEKHRDLLDMLVWDETLTQDVTLTKAVPCKQNQGVLDDEGNMKPTPAYIYVDDALLATVGRDDMEKSLAALIEAMFTVMGAPNVSIRQMHLAIDKWKGAIVGPLQIMLGIDINTNSLLVGTTSEYQTEVRELIFESYIKQKKCFGMQHQNRCTFNVSSMHKLVGKIARLGEGAHWIYKLLSHMYTSLTYALSKNEALLRDSSEEFKLLVQQIKTKQFSKKNINVAKQINFAMKKAAQMIHRHPFRYVINETLGEELDFIYNALEPDSGITFKSPIGHIIPRDPTGSMFGDSCLRGCGGYSLSFLFWWHLEFPLEIILRTLLHRSHNDDGLLVSINCLEYITVIINYCAALVALSTNQFTDDPYPVVLSITDNTSAMNWTTHTSKNSMIGRALARFFCGLMIDSPLGINSKWIATDENKVADEISRIKKEQSNTTTHFSFEYSLLKKQFPELKDCRFFQPSQELLSMIWEIVLTKKCPDLKRVVALKPKDLGKLVT